MDGYSCEWMTSLRKLSLLSLRAAPGIWNVCTGEHLILLFSLWTVYQCHVGEAWWGQEGSLHIKIFLLLHDLKTAFCIFCNMVFCHDRHWNSMWNSCLDASIFSRGKLLFPTPPPLYNCSLKGKLLILYCVILFFINRFHYSILNFVKKWSTIQVSLFYFFLKRIFYMALFIIVIKTNKGSIQMKISFSTAITLPN